MSEAQLALEIEGSAKVVLPPTAEPLAKLYGEPIEALPDGLYIPPDALRVFLERFEGPLDLLLYLIRSQKFDVLDIPMTLLTEQYMEYVELIRQSNLPLAAAYLVMAATLMSIKSRMLLPKRVTEDGQEVEDPRAELMARLLEYEKIRKVAVVLDEMPREGRDFFRLPGLTLPERVEADPVVTPDEVAMSWLDVVGRLKLNAKHKVARQSLSVREHMTRVLRRLQSHPFLSLEDLYEFGDQDLEPQMREQITVWYLALLELGKDRLIELTQAVPYAPIYVTPNFTPANGHVSLFGEGDSENASS